MYLHQSVERIAMTFCTSERQKCTRNLS